MARSVIKKGYTKTWRAFKQVGTGGWKRKEALGICLLMSSPIPKHMPQLVNAVGPGGTNGMDDAVSERYRVGPFEVQH